MRTTIEKKKPDVRSEAGSAVGLSSSPPIPNSAALTMLGGRDKGSSPSLESKMNQRFSKPPVRRQAQIPHAENEADRLSAAINSGTPETVKADMGRRMGADFSHVTFHTGPAAAAMADTMGARAYTTGSDIYFGSGGFDPSVAAHELVHTAQQGMVDSGVQTMSTPAGGVQMLRSKKSKPKMEDAPGLLDTSKLKKENVDWTKSRWGGRKLKSGRQEGSASVAMLPTQGGGSAVLKTGVNPKLESVYSDFYNTGGAIFDKEHKGSWSFRTPGVRAVSGERISNRYDTERSSLGKLLRSDKAGEAPKLQSLRSSEDVNAAIQPELSKMFGSQAGTLAANNNPVFQRAKEDAAVRNELDNMALFSVASGRSRQDPTPMSKKEKGAITTNPSNPAEEADYQRAMGFVAAMDLVTSNRDRIMGSVNYDNWMEDRKNRQINLIDNDFQGIGSLSQTGGQKERADWLHSTLNALERKVNDQGTGTYSADAFAKGLYEYNQDPIFSTDTDLENNPTHQGVRQGFGALPQIRASLQEKFAGSGGEMNPFQQELLERMQIVEEILDNPDMADLYKQLASTDSPIAGKQAPQLSRADIVARLAEMRASRNAPAQPAAAAPTPAAPTSAAPTSAAPASAASPYSSMSSLVYITDGSANAAPAAAAQTAANAGGSGRRSVRGAFRSLKNKFSGKGK